MSLFSRSIFSSLCSLLDMDIVEDVVIFEEALAVRTLVPSDSSSRDSTASSVGFSSPIEVRLDWREIALWKDLLLLLEHSL